jgi:pimeloyl-ACP methyl ester carboxylesterase
MLADAVPEPPLRAFLLQNLELAGGEARWRLNLAAIAANMGRLLAFPEALRDRRYDGPALFLHGTASGYVTGAHHAAIRALFPAAEIRGLEGAGHWLHAEQPEAVREAVAAWLARAVDAG